MMNKPIFILSNSYQKYANFKTNTEYNSQSVAFINESGKESIILGSDLNNTKFRFVPDAPKTNNDLVLKSNNGVFSWVAFPTSSGGTTVVNEGIKPPFDLNDRDKYDNLSWAYYIIGGYDNSGMGTAQKNAPVGTIFSNFNAGTDDYNSDLDGLSIRVPDTWGYEDNLAHIPLELDPKYVSTNSGGLIEDCAILRLFITNNSNGRVPNDFTLNKPYMTFNRGDNWVYINNGTTGNNVNTVAKIVTEERLKLILGDLPKRVNNLENSVTNLDGGINKIHKLIENFKLFNFQRNGLKSEKYTKVLNGTREGITSHTLGISQLDADMLPSTLELYHYLSSTKYFLPSGEDATDFRFQVGDLMKIDGVTGEIGKVFEVIHNVGDITKFNYSYLKRITEAYNDETSSSASRILSDYMNTIKKFISSNAIKEVRIL